jgi:hypothetical protein
MQLGPIPRTNPSDLEGFEKGLSGGERGGRGYQIWSRGGRIGRRWAATRGGPDLTLRTLPPKVLEVRLGTIPPWYLAVGSEGYSS